MSSVYALVAQSVEQLTCNEKVVGSIPIGGSFEYIKIDICKCFYVYVIMSSFKEVLKKSGQSVLDARAQNLYNMTKIEEERYLQECKMNIYRLQNELDNHRDLSVKSTTSLEVGKNFDPKAWVAKRHDLERQLRVAKIEYALAKKVDEEEFSAEELEGISGIDEILNEDFKTE